MERSESLVRDIPGLLISAGIALVSVLVLLESREFDTLGAVFPRAVASLLLVLSVVYGISVLRRPSVRPIKAEGSTGRRIAMFAVMLTWALLIEPLGFLTTSALCYLAALMIANFDRWTPRMALIYGSSGAAVLLGLFLLFRMVLKVPLPSGLLI